MPDSSQTPLPPDETIDSLVARYLESVDEGEPLDQQEYLQQHPIHEAELHRYFENLSVVEALAETEASNNIKGGLRDGCDFPPDPATIDRLSADAETSFAPDGSDEDALDVPREFGRYRIIRSLGRGAMGAVYEAYDTELDRTVALKVPRFDTTNAEELLQRFRREARSAAGLRHPNICPIHDVGEVNGRHYISMACIEGHTLREFARSRTPQPQTQVALTIRKLALALAEAHRQGVIHRDVKSANVMIDGDGEPIVTDFGLARPVTDDATEMTRSGMILGTPAYMAPEQVEADTERIGPASDIYALGVIFYELLTGRLPFTGPIHSVLAQVMHDEPRSPSKFRPDLDPVLEAICLKAIEKRPAERYGSMDELAEDLRRFLTHEPTLARPAGRLRSICRWRRHHPTLAALICLFIVSLTIAVGLVAWALDEQHAARVAQVESEQHTAHVLSVQAMIAGENHGPDVAMLRFARALEEAVRIGDRELESSIRRQLGAWQSELPAMETVFPHGGRVFEVAVSSDSQLVVTCGDDWTARLWDARTGRPVGRALQHAESVYDVAFSPDDSMIVTASGDLTAQLWVTGSGRRRGPPLTHDQRVLTVAFSPDGMMLLTGSDDRTARLWDATTGQPIGVPLEHPDVVRCVAFSPDGSCF